MHLLFLSRPDRGHLYPTLRLAEELGRRGHQVTFASGDPYVDESAGPGVRVLRFGREERGLLELPVFRSRGPVDAVIADPRTADAATAFGWQVVVGDSTRFAGLPYADVFLTDCRLAAVSAALRAGVPMVLAPRTAGETACAKQVAALGIGRLVSPADVPADELRQTVEHLRVDEPTLAIARRLASEIEATGSPETAADRLESLLGAPPVTKAA